MKPYPLHSLALAIGLTFGGALHPLQAAPLLPLQHSGNTTFDPNSGLQWLDLSLTAGQSYQTVLNGWNGYTTTQGFRFATRNEVTQFFTDTGALYFGYPSEPTSANVPAATLALSLLGTTLPQTSLSRSWMYYDPATEPMLPAGYIPSAVFGVGEVFGGYPQEGFFMVPGVFADGEYASPEMASALVRLVPEPAASLLLSAFCALSFLVRKR